MHRWTAARRITTSAVAVAATAVGVAVGASPAAAAPLPDQWTSARATAGNAGTNLGERTITAATAPRLASRWQVRGFVGPRAPVVVGGVVYTVQNVAGAVRQPVLLALDVRTGKRLWRLALRGNGRGYFEGTASAGGVLVLPYSGWGESGGLVAVDLRSRRVLWSRPHPRSPLVLPGQPDTSSGTVVVDSGRVYLRTDNALLVAYDLRTGRQLWQRAPRRGQAFSGIAANGGRAFTTFVTVASGASSLLALDGRTGRTAWSAPGLRGAPVVAGALVVAPTTTGVAAVAAKGCGRASCPPRWRRTVPRFDEGLITIGGATGESLFVSAGVVTGGGLLLRLATATGRVQWSVPRPSTSATEPVRAGRLVWLNDGGAQALAWSVTATRGAPLATVPLPDPQNSSGGLAVARGSLLVQKWGHSLTAFRVRGT